MKQNQDLIGLAFVIVVVQLFLLLLPTTRYDRTKAYDAYSESYSATQMIINYTDTINDPGLKKSNNSAKSELRTFSYIFSAATLFLMLTALVNTVQAFTFDCTSHKKLALLCWASCLLALVPFLSWLFLKMHYEKNVFITLLGILQMLPPIAFPFLFNNLSPDNNFSTPSYSQRYEEFTDKTTPSSTSTKRSCPHCGEIVTSDYCSMCGKQIITPDRPQSSDIQRMAKLDRLLTNHVISEKEYNILIKQSDRNNE